MPIDPSMLATSIATLADLDPARHLAATLEQAVVAAKQLFEVEAAGILLADADGRLRWASASDPLAQALEDSQETFAAGPCLQAFVSGQPAVIQDATLEPHWGEITLAFVELQIRSALSVPVQLGGDPIGTLDVYAAAPGGWDATEISALQTYAGLVATLLGTAAKAERRGRLTEQLQVSLDARNLIEQAKVALEELERLDDRAGRGWWPRSRPPWTHGRVRLGWPSRSRRCWSAAAGRRGRGRLLGCMAGWRGIWPACRNRSASWLVA
jgi:GAF domain-containing protein